jgi:hypothetical protein
MRRAELNALRKAVADYMYSHGCGCCKSPSNDEHKKKLAELLKVPQYKDNSGPDFYRFRTVNNQF